ncbi:MAG: PLP-dependent aminotransferase family protein [Acidobacteria bacterium]|nr:PLP-dependent aminotransferase family protein [Acidobacteriota bacterium]
MTIYVPQLENEGSRYQAIAAAIERDIQVGTLKPGDRLPTHRDLADRLGVTVGTVTRGYAEAERRGLTQAVVGRGTFIRGYQREDPWPEHLAEPGMVDFTLSLPLHLPEEERLLAETLSELARDPRIGASLRYEAESASVDQKSIVASWLQRMGLFPKPEQVLVTCGSQHSLNVVLSSLFQPGQVLVTTALTYPSLKAIAKSFGLKLRAVPMDAEGMQVEGLIKALASEPKPHGVYLDPTLQNPTTAVMSLRRRKEIAEVVRRHDVLLVEDDVHGFLLPEPMPPISSWLPEQSIYLSSVAKCLNPGLRTGFLCAGTALIRRLLSGIHNTVWMPPPLMVELTCRWLANGVAVRLIQAKRLEIQRRQMEAARILAGHDFLAHPYGYQIWLRLPEPWSTEAFVLAGAEAGIKVIGAGAFAVNRMVIPQAIRISLGVPSWEEMRLGLLRLRTLLASSPSSYF